MAEIIHTHTHPVVDTARPFTIDPNTKEIKPGTNNLVLAQHSKDSERFTFTIPGTVVEGHDMTLCNSVMIHFQNIGQNPDQLSIGVYKVTDLVVKNGSVTLSWLIGDEATLYAGGLIFSIHFSCTDKNGEVVYNFPTLTFSKITVGATVWNSGTVAKKYPDIIAEFEARLAAAEKQLGNIGVSCEYYSTEREELGADYADVNTAYILGLYDALATQYPDRVRKKEIRSNDGTFVNYEYAVSTGDYNEKSGSISGIDDDIKKPKYLVASGLHGFEKPSIVSAYRLFRDIVTGHNIPARFTEGCVIRFLPVGNPWGLDNDSRFNGNIDPDTNQGVDINRNFNWDHGLRVQGDKADNVGAYAESEKETQAIANWLRENTDAQLFLDCHNVGSVPNEIATVIGLTDSEAYDKRKKIAMKGIDRVVPFWRDAIGYVDSTIFQHSAPFDEGGMSIFYASEELGIPSLCLEIATRPTGTEASAKNLLPETVAVGAEVIGNVLLEFYEQYSMGEVVDMTETNEKLDGLAEGVTETRGKVDALCASMDGNMATIHAKLDLLLGGTDEPTEPAEPTNGFRMETGVYEVAEGGETGTALIIDCSLEPKILVIEADREVKGEDGKTTYQRILASTEEVFIGAVGQLLTTFLPVEENTASPMYPFYFSYMAKLTNTGTAEQPTWEPKQFYTMFRNNGEKMQFGAPKRVAGRYNWTAYYWNEPEEA